MRHVGRDTMKEKLQHLLKMLENSKNLTFTSNNVKIFSALNDDSRAQLMALAAELWP